MDKIELESIANEQELEVGVDGPNGANRLYIIDGTAAFSLTPGSGRREIAGTLEFPVGPTFSSRKQFERATATAALASIRNKENAVNAKWAVNSVDADYDDESNRVKVKADMEVHDTDGFLNRIGFQVNILARV